MARIIESSLNSRRMIKLSTDDIIAVVKDYQKVVPRFSSSEEIRNLLSDIAIFIPEDL